MKLESPVYLINAPSLLPSLPCFSFQCLPSYRRPSLYRIFLFSPEPIHSRNFPSTFSSFLRNLPQSFPLFFLALFPPSSALVFLLHPNVILSLSCRPFISPPPPVGKRTVLRMAAQQKERAQGGGEARQERERRRRRRLGAAGGRQEKGREKRERVGKTPSSVSSG